MGLFEKEKISRQLDCDTVGHVDGVSRAFRTPSLEILSDKRLLKLSLVFRAEKSETS